MEATLTGGGPWTVMRCAVKQEEALTVKVGYDCHFVEEDLSFLYGTNCDVFAATLFKPNSSSSSSYKN